MNDVTIRMAVSSDQGEILKIWAELSEYYRSLNPLFPIRWQRPEPEPHRSNAIAKFWSDPDHHAGFIAESEGALVGFCRVLMTPEGNATASVHTLFVRPYKRGQGIGELLMTEALQWCKERGADDVSLDVLPANVNAAKFHRSLGFEPFITSYVKRLT